jgi:Mrp family chromosome partitioning ATPase
MGRTLEALRHVDAPAMPAAEPVLTPVFPVPEREPEFAAEEVIAEEQSDDEGEMPFIEVGGPRKAAAAEPKPHLEFPRVRPAAALHMQSPPAVRLQPLTKPAPRVAVDVVAFHQPEHAVSRQYAELFVQIATDAGEELAPVALFTALTPGAGTTTALLNLAVAGCRQHQRRVVVVDLNRARAAAAQRLGLTPTVGLQEVLQGKAALERAVQGTPQDDLSILPAGAAEAPWASDALRWALAWLRQRFDVVLVDAPAWDDEARALVPLASAVYLVVDAAEAQQPRTRAVSREVARLGGRVGGLIVTQ